jgi:hypothetical protein
MVGYIHSVETAHASAAAHPNVVCGADCGPGGGGHCSWDSTIEVCIFQSPAVTKGNIYTEAWYLGGACYDGYQYLDPTNDRGLQAVSSFTPGPCSQHSPYLLGTEDTPGGGTTWQSHACYAHQAWSNTRYCVYSPVVYFT